jgi:hypothetical protein
VSQIAPHRFGNGAQPLPPRAPWPPFPGGAGRPPSCAASAPGLRRVRALSGPFRPPGPSLPTLVLDTKEARGTKNGLKRDRADAGHGEPTADGDRKGDPAGPI